MTLFSDSLHPDMIEEITKAFPGHEYTEDGVIAVINKLLIDLPYYKTELSEFRDWILQEIV